MAYKKVRKMQAKKLECKGGDSIQIAETLSSIGLMQYHMRDSNRHSTLTKKHFESAASIMEPMIILMLPQR
jgi:hypothetical protein